jgi:branched-chain amino acid transport system permease protein
VQSRIFLVVCIAVAAAIFAFARWLGSEYLFFAGYVVVQFVVLATAWNILGGYCGYVNFGSAAFFALGAYTSVFFHKTYPLPVPLLILLGGIVSGIVGFGMGYLTLRLRGAFFAIATLALAVVLQTLIINWNYVGGSRGAYAIRPAALDVFGVTLPYMQLSVSADAHPRGWRRCDRTSHRTPRGSASASPPSATTSLRPRASRRADATAEADRDHALRRADGDGRCAVPLLHLVRRPSSAFGLAYAVNSIAMPMIGGTGTWVGPLVGAILLGSIQEWARVTISSAVNLLIVGVLLVTFVIIAPNGIVGLVQDRLRARKK